MIDAELQRLVADEIDALHVAFERWFRGDLDDLHRVELALSHDFTFISPRGDTVPYDKLMDGLQNARGSRDLRIRIEKPQVQWKAAHAVLATYEEWHDHADYSTGRQTTVLFCIEESTPGGLLWRHVHETWITPPPAWVVQDPAG